MFSKTSVLATVAAIAGLTTTLAPAAVAAPSTASAWQGSLYGDKRTAYELEVTTQAGEQAPHGVVLSYEPGAIVVSDSAGIIAVPSTSSGPADDCLETDATSVRCPVDLPAKRNTTVIDVELGSGDDLVDFRGLPKLPGHGPLESTEFGPGPASPQATTGLGDDMLLTGPAGTSSALGHGADILRGGAGSDRVNGGPGGDRLFGGGGRDFLWAGFGNDFLVGGSGRDLMSGDQGNDRLKSRDGRVDLISCGPGTRGKQSAIRDSGDHAFRSTHSGTSRLNCR